MKVDVAPDNTPDIQLDIFRHDDGGIARAGRQHDAVAGTVQLFDREPTLPQHDNRVAWRCIDRRVDDQLVSYTPLEVYKRQQPD